LLREFKSNQRRKSRHQRLKGNEPADLPDSKKRETENITDYNNHCTMYKSVTTVQLTEKKCRHAEKQNVPTAINKKIA